MMYVDMDSQGTALSDKWALFQICHYSICVLSPIHPAFVMLLPPHITARILLKDHMSQSVLSYYFIP